MWLLCWVAGFSAHEGYYDDSIAELPTYGVPPAKQYAGFAEATRDGKNRLHYWFAECDCGNSPDVPLLLWLNGGPGASSLTGMFAEKCAIDISSISLTIVCHCALSSRCPDNGGAGMAGSGR